MKIQKYSQKSKLFKFLKSLLSALRQIFMSHVVKLSVVRFVRHAEYLTPVGAKIVLADPAAAFVIEDYLFD